MKMKTLAALLAFSIPMAAVANPRGIEVKKPMVVQDVPDCSDGLPAGTLCRYVPVSSWTMNIPNVQGPNFPALPLKVLQPPGFRMLHTQIRVEVSPSSVCDPAPSDAYEGVGGLTIDCDQQ